MIKELRLAIGFLTILPVNPTKIKANDLAAALSFFPLVGVIYAVITWGVASLSGEWLSPELKAWLVLLLLIILNGGIHIDGLADTADGFGGNTSAKRLEIMKDSRLGTFGGVALFGVLFGKAMALAALINSSFGLFATIFALSRWSMVVMITTQNSVSQGLLKLFNLKKKYQILGLATFWLVLALVFSKGTGFILLLVTILGLLIWQMVIKKYFGGITGDILGATNELVELGCLLILNLLRINLS